MHRSVTSLLVACLTAFTSLASVSPSTKQSRIPPAFVRNVGQVCYTTGKPAPHVDAVFSVGGTTALVHTGGMHIVQMVPSKSLQLREEESKQQVQVSRTPESTEFDLYRMDLVLIGSNRNARLEWLDQQAGYSRFLTSPTDGPEGRIANHYARMYYHDVWPGIDMRTYVIDGGIEYDFIVHPGADPNRIAFFLDGAQEMGLTTDNALKVSTPLGTMSEAAPYSYVYSGIETKETSVESHFIVDGRSVRFSTGAYDRTQTLVIDPTRVWATYFGYSNYVSDLNAAVDTFGNSFLSGTTGATNLPEVTGVLQKRYKARSDGFIAKFTETGKFVWSTYFGGTGADRVRGICADQNGNVYVCGRTESELATLPAGLGVGSAPFGDPDSLGVANGFVLGLSPTGAWIDHWFLYGRNEDEVNDITFRNDKLAIVGTSRSVRVCEKVGTPFIHDDFNNFTNQDIFVSQFSRKPGIPNRWSGDWLTFAGGELDDQGVAVGMDPQGSVYIVGMTMGREIQTTDGSALPGGGDFYVAKFTGANNNATHNWGTIVGGSSLDIVLDLAVDAMGAAILVGRTSSSDFPLKTPLKGVLDGAQDAFVRKYNTDGTVQWSTFHGGPAADVFNSVSIDRSNRIWACGGTSSTTGITITSGAFQPAAYDLSQWGGLQGYFAQFRADGGQVLYGSYYSAPPDANLPDPPLPIMPPPPFPLDDTDDLGVCSMSAIACDANANVLMIHEAETHHMSTTVGAYQDSSKLDHTNYRLAVSFLTLFTNCVDTVINSTINGSPALCVGDSRQIIGPAGFASYLWSNGAATKNITVTDSGQYVLIVTNTDGCRFRDTVIIIRNAKPVVNAGTDVSRCKDTVVTLSVSVSSGTAPFKFKWSRIESGPEHIDTDTSQTPKVNPPTTSSYEVVVTDAVGCISKDTVRITIIDPKPTGPASTVDFGVLDACEPTRDADVVITNPMPYELRVGAFSSDIASIVTSLSPPPSIPANGSITLSIRISPTQVGVTTGTLRFSGSPCAWSVSVPYRVEKARLTATVSPSTIGFGASADCENVQRDSTVVIRNGSPDPMTVNPGTILPAGQPFTIVSPTIPTVVSPNDSLAVVIRYAPISTGTFSAAISFPFTAGTCNGTLTVNLNASRSAVTVVADPSTVDVGTLGGCQDFADTILTITNAGDVSVTVTLPTIAGVSFTPPGPLTLSAGAIQTMTVRITPVGQGAFSFSPTILAEPCGITRTLTYSGAKAGATVTVPSDINFGEVSACSGQDFAIRPFTIVYNGAGDANVVTVSHGPTVQTTLGSGMLLVSGVAQAFDITWSPVADGAFVDSLVLVVEPCSIRRVIRLVGERTNVSLIASTPLVNLGVITGPEVGQVAFVNNGTDTISAIATAVTPDVSVTSTIPTTLTSILPGGSILVNYELNCRGRTDVSDTVRVSSLTPCVVDATTAFTGTCGAAPVASADIAIDSARVRTGDTFLVALRIVRSTGLNAVNAHTWTARIAYNPGVLVGTGATPDCFSGSFTPCSIDVQGTRGSDTTGVLLMLNFRAVLGTDSATDLTIETFAWTDASVAPISTRNGHVTLTDICQEGGTRLLKPKAGAFGIELNPAPAIQNLTISATELGTDVARYTMHNIIGTNVASGTLVPDADGHAETTLDVSSLGAGTYVFTVEARGHVLRQMFFINR